ncbi:hypothetical protein CONCODRAFT_11031 [Conidiobolus coronatus NRRL 28638]|uniref:Neurotransmitter-gated ion-channel ligand-binding domain-containing protein n=1 Tax=Conidiobolus coronatus (strain ATCC 28846 / CBS 209.66 / NRRL 28638) TaxID=796925 RepID=A0A137NW44_CONC2|nr:hypothetical protein CONCODRAFT_11031 [Conidiobolus coronatus NRRL 28638]|eukprot:KXN66992.1 hypothetical protein CONCODRAFT_11031 [Conidiobolus coronatus NRRL 28638]
MMIFVSKSVLDYPQLVPDPPNTDLYIQLDLSLQQQDLNKKTVNYLVNFKPSGLSLQDGPTSWDRDIVFDFYPSQLVVKNGTIIKPFRFEVDLVDGSSKDYPFDEYLTDLGFHAYDNSTNQTIPLSINANLRTISTTTRFNPRTLFTELGDKIYYFEVIVYRSKVVFVFCFFISLLTWILTILAMILAFDTVVYGRELPPPIMSLGVAILFALPAIRRTQPGIPDIGCAIDYLCFFWCETLVALSTCVIIGCYTLRYNKPSSNPI